MDASERSPGSSGPPGREMFLRTVAFGVVGAFTTLMLILIGLTLGLRGEADLATTFVLWGLLFGHVYLWALRTISRHLEF